VHIRTLKAIVWGSALGLFASSSGAAAPKAEKASYTVRLSAKPKYKKGQPGIVEFVIVPKAGYKVNDKYPTKFTVNEAPSGVRILEKVATPKDGAMTKHRGVVELKIIPSKAGTMKVGGDAAFSVCSETACIVGKEHLDVVVHAL
jgi:hypothetical protein